jgi:hypothetical protein
MPHATPEPQLIPPSPEPRRTTLNPNSSSWYPKKHALYYVEQTPDGPRVVSKEELNQRPGYGGNPLPSGEEMIRDMIKGESMTPSACALIDASKIRVAPQHRELMMELFASTNDLLWNFHVRSELRWEASYQKEVQLYQRMDRLGFFCVESEADYDDDCCLVEDEYMDVDYGGDDHSEGDSDDIFVIVETPDGPQFISIAEHHDKKSNLTGKDDEEEEDGGKSGNADEKNNFDEDDFHFLERSSGQEVIEEDNEEDHDSSHGKNHCDDADDDDDDDDDYFDMETPKGPVSLTKWDYSSRWANFQTSCLKFEDLPMPDKPLDVSQIENALPQ